MSLSESTVSIDTASNTDNDCLKKKKKESTII